MMVGQTPEHDGRHPTDELGPELRQAVKEVRSQSPPEDLVQRTLDRVRQRRPTVTRASPTRRALLGALATAATIAVVVWFGQDRNGRDGAAAPAPPPVAVEPADRLPTYWAYRRASLDSPEALEELLDKHASHLLVTDPESLRIGAFSGLALEML